MIRRCSLVVVGLVVAAACSGGGGSSGTSISAPVTSRPASPDTGLAPTSTNTTAVTPTSPATTAAVTTTVPPPEHLPAGAQYGSPAVPLPEDTAAIVRFGDRWLAVGTQPDPAIDICAGAPGCGHFARQPFAYTSRDGVEFQATQMDDLATFPTPAGFRLAQGFVPSSIAVGPGGIVVVGNVNIWDSRRYFHDTVRSVIWHSADGMEWQRIDVRDVVGDTSLELTEVRATAGGYLAVGQVAGRTLFEAPSRGIVLTSPDGVAWAVAAELALPYSVELYDLQEAGGTLLVTGVEYVCTSDAGAMSNFSVGAQTRVWSSRDGGTTWRPVDLASTGVTGDIPDPPDQCPESLQDRSALGWSAGFVSAAGTTFAVGSSDRSEVAVSTDLVSWTVAPLERGTRGESEGVQRNGAVLRRLVADAEGLYLLSLEAPRDADGVPLALGYQGRVWRSDDGGASWVPLGLPRPVVAHGNVDLVDAGDGSVLLVDTVSSGFAASTVTFRRSEAGPLLEWGMCEPAPQIDCSFADVSGLDLSGRDLSGIDLSGADLSGTDLARAVLTDARLEGARLTGAVLTGADLRGADLSFQVLSTFDLTGAMFDDADLRGAILPESVIAGGTLPDAQLTRASIMFDGTNVRLDLSGRDLREVSFTGPFGGRADLSGSDFSGADLRQTSFSRVNLTGANFGGATLEGQGLAPAYFGTDTICPDGQPVEDTAIGRARCRL